MSDKAGQVRDRWREQVLGSERDEDPVGRVWHIWLAATLALGPAVDWYPYPFLRAPTIGWGSTLLDCTAIAVLFLALAALAPWADRRLSRSRATMNA